MPSSDPCGPSKRALVLPGSGYTSMAPLLYWCIAMLEEEGWSVSAAKWPSGQRDIGDPHAVIEAVVEREASVTRPDLIVAKSLGTYAAQWAVQQHIPGVWLTPVASDSRVLSALRSLDASSLVVAGTRDRYWTRGALGGAPVHTLEVEDADHSLETPHWRASLQLQAGVYDRIYEHLTTFAFASR